MRFLTRRRPGPVLLGLAVAAARGGGRPRVRYRRCHRGEQADSDHGGDVQRRFRPLRRPSLQDSMSVHSGAAFAAAVSTRTILSPSM